MHLRVDILRPQHEGRNVRNRAGPDLGVQTWCAEAVVDGRMDFDDLPLDERLLRAVADEGYRTPTPVQAMTIPALLDGRDVLGVAQTGTGKTAAFALPILHHLAAERPAHGRPIRALILSPTRELAAQIGDRVRAYGHALPLRSFVIFGGVGHMPQVKALRKGVDVLIATPGRLLDLEEQGHLDLSDLTHLVLDEADRMLDMGFIRDVRRILALLPKRRQNLLFSATMPKGIRDLVSTMLHDPVRVDVSPEAPTTDRIDQYVAFVRKSDKRRLLVELIEAEMVDCGIVFTRTKHGANRLAQQLDRAGIAAEAIHGNKSQSARVRALEAFRRGDVPLLIATNIAARGIDVEDITHVFNYDLPNEPEDYVHRIGRTARAGRRGVAYSFCDETESGYLVGIQRLLGASVPVFEDHRYHHPEAVPKPGQRPGRVKPTNASNNANKRPRSGNRNKGHRGKSLQGKSHQGKSRQGRQQRSGGSRPRDRR